MGLLWKVARTVGCPLLRIAREGDVVVEGQWILNSANRWLGRVKAFLAAGKPGKGDNVSRDVKADRKKAAVDIY